MVAETTARFSGSSSTPSIIDRSIVRTFTGKPLRLVIEE
jgi:hypothetical protein